MKSADPAQLARKLIQNSGRHIFLTGKAGTGKTTFLRAIKESTYKKVVVAAPTGIAAINAGGVTLHSLFQLPYGTFIPEDRQPLEVSETLRVHTPLSLMKTMRLSDRKRRLLREIELLIIDEVSMLRADLLDAMDQILKSVRRDKRAFGGLQILFIGDLLQLPPVVKPQEWAVLKEFYPSLFFFNALSLRTSPPVFIELEKVYRQDDETFIRILNHLRNGKLNKEDLELLNHHFRPSFKAEAKDLYITLTTHNHKAEKINAEYLEEIQEPSHFFDAVISNDFPESMYPLEARIELKKGAQIMFIKNDPTGQQRFFNGMIGTINHIQGNKISVAINDGKNSIEAEPYEWENVRFETNEENGEVVEKTIGTFTQYPLRLAWAITVHKSQGLTFDKAIIDPNEAFAPGQVYVALSRLKSLNGLILTSRIPQNIIQPDYHVQNYSLTKSDDKELEKISETESRPFLQQTLRDAYQLNGLYSSFLRIGRPKSDEESGGIRKRDEQWQQGIQEKLKPIADYSGKFLIQVNGILSTDWPQSLSTLIERLNAAKNYFLPLLWDISTEIIIHLAVLREVKKIKQYFGELRQFEEDIFTAIKKIEKASLIGTALHRGTEISRSDITTSDQDKSRAKLLEKLKENGITDDWEDETSETFYRKTRSKKEKKLKIPKEAKPETRSITLSLFKEGKSLEEIATERNLAITTIASHLATFITDGLLKIEEVMEVEKIEPIRKVIELLQVTNLSPVKEKLGDEFSYHEIRFVMNFLEREKRILSKD